MAPEMVFPTTRGCPHTRSLQPTGGRRGAIGRSRDGPNGDSR
jgi:hypothetical protein